MVVEPEYVFAWFGTIRRFEDAKLLRDLGFNSFSGGYRMNLKGFAKDGTPDIDFSKMDEYQDMLKKAGYTQEGWGYGGFQVTHIGYTKDEAFFGKYEQETGLSYVELLKRVFDAVGAGFAVRCGGMTGVPLALSGVGLRCHFGLGRSAARAFRCCRSPGTCRLQRGELIVCLLEFHSGIAHLVFELLESLEQLFRLQAIARAAFLDLAELALDWFDIGYGVAGRLSGGHRHLRRGHGRTGGFERRSPRRIAPGTVESRLSWQSVPIYR